jgi:hypothetical protein
MKRFLLLVVAAAAVMVTACGDAGYEDVFNGVYQTEPRGIALESAEDLAKIGVDGDYPLSGAYYLAADIDLSEWEGDWTPIGTDTAPFSAVLDGRGKTIRGFSFGAGGDAVYTGLFGYLLNARLSNLTIEVEYSAASLSLTGYEVSGFDSPHQYAGIAAGYIKSSNIKNVTVRGAGNGSISIEKEGGGNVYTGGIAGKIENSLVSNVTADVRLNTSFEAENTFNDNLYIGVLTGEITGGTLTGSQAEGSIEANAPQGGNVYAGGLVGNTTALLENCSSAVTQVDATVSGAGGISMNVGGIAGASASTITSSSLKADSAILIQALYEGSANYCTVNVGGISGDGYNATITKCVVDADVQIIAEASVDIALNAGGIAGQSADVRNSLVKRGTVQAISTITGTPSYSSIFAGGISGTIASGKSIEDCFSRADVTAENALNVTTPSATAVTAAGGIVGGFTLSGSIERSGASGTVTVQSTNASSVGTVFAGGLLGFASPYSAITINNSAALNTQVQAEAAGTVLSANRVLGGILSTANPPALVTDSTGLNTLQSNYALEGMTVRTGSEGDWTAVDSPNDTGGLAGSDNGFEVTQAFFADTLGWDFAKAWDWDDADDLPVPRL